jgi:hypothetical protein
LLSNIVAELIKCHCNLVTFSDEKLTERLKVVIISFLRELRVEEEDHSKSTKRLECVMQIY